MCHVSHLKCHVSPVMYHISIVTLVKLVGVGSVTNGALSGSAKKYEGRVPVQLLPGISNMEHGISV